MESNARQRLLWIAAIVCGAAFLGDKLVFTPVMTLWNKRAETITELEKSLNKGRMLMDRETNLRDQWNDIRNNCLPEEKALAENQVMKSHDRWVTDSGIGSLSFKPQWKEEEDDHRTIECRSVTQGNLPQIARFLYELEKEKMPLKLENIEIKANDERGDKLTLTVQYSGLRIVDTTDTKEEPGKL